MSRPKPKLPREMYRPSVAGSLAFIGHGMLLHYGAGLGIFYLLRSDAPLWLAAPVAVVLALIAGQGIHNYGLVGHQAFHGGMFRSKRANILAGIAVSSSIPGGFCVVGYYAGHWNHHLYTNTTQDPDINLHEYRSFLSKLLLLRFRQNAVFRSQTITLARGKDLPFASRLPIAPDRVVQLARLNLAACLVVLAVHVGLFFVSPLLGLSLVLLPVLGVFIVSGPRPFLEHGDLGVGEGLDSRSRTSALSTFFYFWNNYHLEHHLYPSVPCFRLGRVHRILRESGYFEGGAAAVEPTLMGGLRHMFGRYPAGAAEAGAPVVTVAEMDPADDDRIAHGGQLPQRG